MKKIIIFGIFCLTIFLLLPNNIVKAADGCTCTASVNGPGCIINGSATIDFGTSVTAGSIINAVDTTQCPFAKVGSGFFPGSYSVTQESCNGKNEKGTANALGNDYIYSVSCSGGTGPVSNTSVDTTVASGVPTNASGQTATLGGLDFRCWKLSDCLKRREALGISADKAKEMGIYQGLDAVKACGGKETPDKTDKVGFCTAITNTETRTSFAGKSNFTGILDFIQYIYQYAVVIGGVLALIMLIIAGFQWTISGGNSEQKQAAQKRISGAFMGLLILFLSYTVLNTISPYLVNLRAPQTWMINTVSLAPKYCKDLNAPAKVAFAYGQSEAIQKQDLDTRFRAVTAYDVDPVVGAGCGDNFFVENGSGMTCLGTYCGGPTTPSAGAPTSTPTSTLSNTGANKTCYKMTEQEPYQCMPGNITGKIMNSDIKATLPVIGEAIPGRDTWAWEWSHDLIGVAGVCKDGKVGIAVYGDVKVFDEEKKIQYFQGKIEGNGEDAVNKCKNNSGFKGFVILATLRETPLPYLPDEYEDHYIGINASDPIDLGDRGAFEKTAVTSPQEYFFTTTSLSLGLILDIDVKNICDIDNDQVDRLSCYKDLGYR